jgi:hypothetical protein
MLLNKIEPHRIEQTLNVQVFGCIRFQQLCSGKYAQPHPYPRPPFRRGIYHDAINSIFAIARFPYILRAKNDCDLQQGALVKRMADGHRVGL